MFHNFLITIDSYYSETLTAIIILVYALSSAKLLGEQFGEPYICMVLKYYTTDFLLIKKGNVIKID